MLAGGAERNVTWSRPAAAHVPRCNSVRRAVSSPRACSCSAYTRYPKSQCPRYQSCRALIRNGASCLSMIFHWMDGRRGRAQSRIWFGFHRRSATLFLPVAATVVTGCAPIYLELLVFSGLSDEFPLHRNPLPIRCCAILRRAGGSSLGRMAG